MRSENRDPLIWLGDVERVSGTVLRVLASRPPWFLTLVRLADGKQTKLPGIFPSPGPSADLSFEGLHVRMARTSRGDSLHILPDQPDFRVVPGVFNDLGVADEVIFDSYGLPVTSAGLSDYLYDAIRGLDRNTAQLMTSELGPIQLLDALDNARPVFFLDTFRMEVSFAIGLLDTWRSKRDEHRAEIALRCLGLKAEHARTALLHAMSRAQQSGKPITPLGAACKIARYPYRLAALQGVGFKVADRAAGVMKAPLGDRDRILAAARHVLEDIAKSKGHTVVAAAHLVTSTIRLLEDENPSGRAPGQPLEPELVQNILLDSDPDRAGFVFPIGAHGGRSPVGLNDVCQAEAMIARRIGRMIRASKGEPVVQPPPMATLKAICGFTPDPKQIAAVELCLAERFSILHGGPGCGKTSVSKGVAHSAKAAGRRILLLSPTGRAAKRMAEAIGLPAQTVHSALEYGGPGQGFRRNAEHPLDADTILLDEAGMSDVTLFRDLLEAVRPDAQLILIGDQDQLPSVYAGAVLADLVNCGCVPVARLSRGFRTAATNPINPFARSVRNGDAQLPPASPSLRFDQLESDEMIVRRLLEELQKHINAGAPIDEIIVLAPMRRGLAGINHLNGAIQDLVNPRAKSRGLPVGWNEGFVAAPGDRVMWTSRDNDLGLVNSDTGIVTRVSQERRRLWADFGAGEMEVPGHKLKSMTLAYAVTVHKAQGSEYRHVLMPISPAHRAMTRRNLLYTGITRAKQTLWMGGDPSTFFGGVQECSDYDRQTMLRLYLRDQAVGMDQVARGVYEVRRTSDPIRPAETSMQMECPL